MLSKFRKPAAPVVRPRRVHRELPSTWVEVPSDYTDAARWSPRIGEYFPNFSGDSTDGRITFHPYTSGHWTIFFSIAAAFSETCTVELAELSGVQQELCQEGVKVIGIARNTVAELHSWRQEVSRRSGHQVTLPILSDPEGILTSTFGMIHPLQDENSTIRKTLIIDPRLRVSMNFEYPLYISRSIEELLRTLDAARDHYQENLLRGRHG
ncbi:redoxin domain-containing protein [Oceanicola sp. S124]|uniref:redoxin domain-containing protein n=1 Tax=Oceanicola sp. S124 TaxID=1042378 RepID=UPI0002558D0F|nr:redoxin domain-containing protein [Oceanicola sp. S124]